jgi:hypothetical protein
MYIPTVRVFTIAPITALTVEAMRVGIEHRIALLTYLFCPEDEQPPESVLEQLRIESISDDELKLRWKPRMRYPPRAYRFGDELTDQKQMAKFGLRSYTEQIVAEHHKMIDSAVDGAGFFQGYDRDDMGWPVVMAGASALVDQAGGVIVTNGYGWFVPSGNEVRCILEPDTNP